MGKLAIPHNYTAVKRQAHKEARYLLFKGLLCSRGVRSVPRTQRTELERSSRCSKGLQRALGSERKSTHSRHHEFHGLEGAVLPSEGRENYSTRNHLQTRPRSCRNKRTPTRLPRLREKSDKLQESSACRKVCWRHTHCCVPVRPRGAALLTARALFADIAELHISDIGRCIFHEEGNLMDFDILVVPQGGIYQCGPPPHTVPGTAGTARCLSAAHGKGSPIKGLLES